MNDNEIIKALKEHIKRTETIKYGVKKTTYVNAELLKDTLDLINRQQAEKEALIAGQETMSKYIEEQQAEIERLSKKNEELAEILSDTIRIRYAEAKAEAIKEFAERLKEDFKNSTLWGLASFDRIDNLVKEMVGDAE